MKVLLDTNVIASATATRGLCAGVAIVSAALNGAADLLVTGDKEILDLRRVGPLEILTPRQFWDKERGHRD